MPRPKASVRIPKAQQFSRPPLARMLQLHQQLKAGRFPNCRKLADELEVSSKTIQRDIEFMRYQLGLPIEYDQLHFGFFYTEPVTSFPSIEVSEGEIVALFVAQKALAQYRGTSFEKPLKAAFRKSPTACRRKWPSSGTTSNPRSRSEASARPSPILSCSRRSAARC